MKKEMRAIKMAHDNGTSVADVRREAEKEIREERLKAAKVQIKDKLQQIETAEQVLANLRRELDELEHELEEGL